MKHQVFVSYAHLDRADFDEIVPRLTEMVPENWTVWTDDLLPDDLDPNDSDAARALIEGEMRRSAAFLGLISENFKLSGFITDIEVPGVELEQALYTEIIIINLDGVALEGHGLEKYEIQVTGNWRSLLDDEREAVLRQIVDTLPGLQENREGMAAG